ncbi:MAG: 16S rRNA methyltransferase [Caldilineaceae bacterium]|nr:16S rRNA methyltransferase [Caldilineaceae bacterium]
MMGATELAALVAAVREGAKYRHLDSGLVEAVAAAELAKGRSFKESVKATRNKLHQVAGAYLPDRPDYAKWLKVISQAANDDEQRAAYRQVMAYHASTRERLPFLDTFYSTILGDLPPVHSVLDLACGLNPLAAAWMPLAAGARYDACDIYQDQIGFLNHVFQQREQPGQAFIGNLLVDVPNQAADVALLLKTIPCLEQADKNIGARLLAQINAPVIVVSFPARSLGGRSKGMVQNYADHFADLVAGQPWQVNRFDFPTEMVFRLIR